jgi:hypothetical protein
MTFTLHQPQHLLTFARAADAAGCGVVSAWMPMNNRAAIALRSPKQPGSRCTKVSRDEQA